MLNPQDIDWLGWASRLNQLSLLPFLAFLYTLSHIPDAPKGMVRGWYLYIVFIAVAVPAGIYSKTNLGTSMANIDWIHGPCELLLTLANLFIVLGLRDAVSRPPPAEDTTTCSTQSADCTSSPSSSTATSSAVDDTTSIQFRVEKDWSGDPSQEPQGMASLLWLMGSLYIQEPQGTAVKGCQEMQQSVRKIGGHLPSLQQRPESRDAGTVAGVTHISGHAHFLIAAGKMPSANRGNACCQCWRDVTVHHTRASGCRPGQFRSVPHKRTSLVVALPGQFVFAK